LQNVEAVGTPVVNFDVQLQNRGPSITMLLGRTKTKQESIRKVLGFPGIPIKMKDQFPAHLIPNAGRVLEGCLLVEVMGKVEIG
jgi:hypothetical protein